MPDEYKRASCHLSVTRSVALGANAVPVAALAARRAAEPEDPHAVALDTDAVSTAGVACVVWVIGPSTSAVHSLRPSLKLSNPQSGQLTSPSDQTMRSGFLHLGQLISHRPSRNLIRFLKSASVINPSMPSRYLSLRRRQGR